MAKPVNPAVIIAMLEAERDDDFSNLLSLKTATDVVNHITTIMNAAITDTNRLRHALLLGATVRVGVANGIFRDVKDIAKAVNYPIPHLNLCARLFDGKAHMMDAAAWAVEHRTALVREHKYVVDGEGRTAIVGFNPRKADGIEWQIAANDAYAMFRRLRRDHEEDDKIVGALSVEDAVIAVRDAYTNLPTAESKAEREAKRKAKILAEAKKYGAVVMSPLIEIRDAPIEIKKVVLSPAIGTTETLEEPMTLGKRHPEQPANA